jgi:hypothetical protein
MGLDGQARHLDAEAPDDPQHRPAASSQLLILGPPVLRRDAVCPRYAEGAGSGELPRDSGRAGFP